MDDRRNKRDLKFDLFATKRARGWQARDQLEGAIELFDCFHQGRSLERTLPRFAPLADCLLDLTSGSDSDAPATRAACRQSR